MKQIVQKPKFRNAGDQPGDIPEDSFPLSEVYVDHHSEEPTPTWVDEPERQVERVISIG